jgi:hypothetical protein
MNCLNEVMAIHGADTTGYQDIIPVELRGQFIILKAYCTPVTKEYSAVIINCTMFVHIVDFLNLEEGRGLIQLQCRHPEHQKYENRKNYGDRHKEDGCGRVRGRVLNPRGIFVFQTIPLS